MISFRAGTCAIFLFYISPSAPADVQLTTDDFVNGGRAPTCMQIDRRSVRHFENGGSARDTLCCPPPPPPPNLYELVRHLRNRLLRQTHSGRTSTPMSVLQHTRLQQVKRSVIGVRNAAFDFGGFISYSPLIGAILSVGFGECAQKH